MFLTVHAWCLVCYNHIHTKLHNFTWISDCRLYYCTCRLILPPSECMFYVIEYVIFYSLAHLATGWHVVVVLIIPLHTFLPLADPDVEQVRDFVLVPQLLPLLHEHWDQSVQTLHRLSTTDKHIRIKSIRLSSSFKCTNSEYV